MQCWGCASVSGCVPTSKGVRGGCTAWGCVVAAGWEGEGLRVVHILAVYVYEIFVNEPHQTDFDRRPIQYFKTMPGDFTSLLFIF